MIVGNQNSCLSVRVAKMGIEKYKMANPDSARPENPAGRDSDPENTLPGPPGQELLTRERPSPYDHECVVWSTWTLTRKVDII